MTRTVVQVIETGGPGGAETIVARLSVGLRDQGCSVLVLAPGGDWLESSLRRAHAAFESFPFEGRSAISTCIGLRSRLRSRRPSVVHAHLLGAATYSALAVLGLRMPVVTTLHGMPDVTAGYRFTAERFALLTRKPNRVVCVSRNLREQVAEEVGVSPHSIGVAYNGLSVPGRTGRTSVREWRRDAMPVARAIGNLREAKDYPTLLRAAAILKARGCPIRFEIAGRRDGGPAEAIIGMRDALGLQATVQFVGFREDTSSFLQDAAVLVSSSSQEGFSLAVAEALLMGVPVVATRSGGPEEILAGGRYGELVSVGDPEALAAAILKTVLDPQGSERRTLHGAAHVRSAYSVERMLDHYQSIYDDVSRCVDEG